jgi:hypothetical protein
MRRAGAVPFDPVLQRRESVAFKESFVVVRAEPRRIEARAIPEKDARLFSSRLAESNQLHPANPPWPPILLHKTTDILDSIRANKSVGAVSAWPAAVNVPGGTATSKARRKVAADGEDFRA